MGRKEPGSGGKEKKRKREDGDDGGASTSGREAGEKATIGMQTSGIRNKLVRSELYQKLKHKQKVGLFGGLAWHGEGLQTLCTTILSCCCS